MEDFFQGQMVKGPIYSRETQVSKQEEEGRIMDKLKLTGQNLGRVFNSRLGCSCIDHAIVHITKRPNLVENSAQTAFRFSPISFRTPR